MEVATEWLRSISCLYAEIADLPAQETRFGTLGSVREAAPDHRQAWVLEYPVLVLDKSHSEPSGAISVLWSSSFGMKGGCNAHHWFGSGDHECAQSSGDGRAGQVPDTGVSGIELGGVLGCSAATGSRRGGGKLSVGGGDGAHRSGLAASSSLPDHAGRDGLPGQRPASG